MIPLVHRLGEVALLLLYANTTALYLRTVTLYQHTAYRRREISYTVSLVEDLGRFHTAATGAWCTTRGTPDGVPPSWVTPFQKGPSRRTAYATFSTNRTKGPLSAPFRNYSNTCVSSTCTALSRPDHTAHLACIHWLNGGKPFHNLFSDQPMHAKCVGLRC